MGMSKKQLEREARICKCGCGTTFHPFPIYRPKSEGGGLKYPEYIRGHSSKGRFGTKPAWNKGLKKGDHPSLERMGFQPGHEPYCDWSHVIERLRNDPELRAKWIASKIGQKAWNKGKTLRDYPNGVKRGPEHGNYAGNPRYDRDAQLYRDFRQAMYVRDDWTCQQCGDRNFEGRGVSVKLELHHIIPVSFDPALLLDPNNVTTLCEPCHHKTDSFGSKAAKYKKKRLELSGK